MSTVSVQVAVQPGIAVGRHTCRRLLSCTSRQRRGAEEKLEVAREVSQENSRLQEKLHSYRKEVRQLEASRHVLQAQVRSASHDDLLSLADLMLTL